jgi:hypothetical protein
VRLARFSNGAAFLSSFNVPLPSFNKVRPARHGFILIITSIWGMESSPLSICISVFDYAMPFLRLLCVANKRHSEWCVLASVLSTRLLSICREVIGYGRIRKEASEEDGKEGAGRSRLFEQPMLTHPPFPSLYRPAVSLATGLLGQEDPIRSPGRCYPGVHHPPAQVCARKVLQEACSLGSSLLLSLCLTSSSLAAC